MKVYVLILSESFPKSHPRAEEPTSFLVSLILREKCHTLRGNFEFWRKRFEKIEAGKAVLSVRIWQGKPYKKDSKQHEILRLSKKNKIGLEKLELDHSFSSCKINGQTLESVEVLAQNDGLSFPDFKAWFKDYDLSKPMAIIHFTGFRYCR